MRKLYLLLPLLWLSVETLGQSTACGLSQQTAHLIKQRLLYQRQLYSRQEVKDLLTNRTITYLPVSFHSVSNSLGEGAATERQIFSFLCGLNSLYADQNVQFYIHNQIHFRVSDAIDSDASSSVSTNTMNNWSIPGTINITIGRSINNQWASWYSYNDYIFLLKSMMSPQAKVEAHEIGHFFGLPHTFYGWEGTNAEVMYNGTNAPAMVNGHPVERVSRTSGSNCLMAGDGFCGTEADYYSSRTNCPYFVTVKDPLGASLNPDETNIMSYASDDCMNSFSADQKAAIAIDIAQRTWVSNAPNGTTDLAAIAAPQAIAPLNNTTLGPISNPTVRLEWEQLPGAPWHYVEVYGTIINGLWLPNISEVIYRGYQYNAQNYLDLSTANLQLGKHYVWRVTPISNYSTCALPSSFYRFEASAMLTSLQSLGLNQSFSLDIIENPVTKSSILTKIYTAETAVVSVCLYTMDGHKIYDLTKKQLSKGDNWLRLPADKLPNAMYVLLLRTEKGLIQRKLTIQR